MDPEEARDADDDPTRDACWESYFERSIGAVIAVSRELTRRTRADRCVRRVAAHGRLCHRRMRSKSGERWRGMASLLRRRTALLGALPEPLLVCLAPLPDRSCHIG